MREIAGNKEGEENQGENNRKKWTAEDREGQKKIWTLSFCQQGYCAAHIKMQSSCIVPLARPKLTSLFFFPLFFISPPLYIWGYDDRENDLFLCDTNTCKFDGECLRIGDSVTCVCQFKVRRLIFPSLIHYWSYKLRISLLLPITWQFISLHAGKLEGKPGNVSKSWQENQLVSGRHKFRWENADAVALNAPLALQFQAVPCWFFFSLPALLPWI